MNKAFEFPGSSIAKVLFSLGNKAVKTTHCAGFQAGARFAYTQQRAAFGVNGILRTASPATLLDQHNKAKLTPNNPKPTPANMPTEGVYYSPTGKKTVIPLENNPEVFTSLIHDLGISPDLGFFDVYSLDEPSLLALVPRPALALIFISPAPMYYAVRAADGTKLAKEDGVTYTGSGPDEPVIWFRQTIENACGLYALIHAVGNGPAREFVQEGSLIESLLKEAEPLGWEQRADVLYNSQPLEEAHMKAARRGDTAAPPAEEKPGTLHVNEPLVTTPELDSSNSSKGMASRRFTLTFLTFLTELPGTERGVDQHTEVSMERGSVGESLVAGRTQP
ncbi:ubiquitin carboxyl-terminal hydrolase, family 1 [Colletotrichum salicis]|uniref:Ubiquitin carboxyl-terminal hydrolase n=1 Tax=Colletotrichum salicis TaxID=1209931 RepID=A0A135SAP6_9PEZI|nr:ubiquitin carboxyl-terminal hydrolase, family 1 [Colletotrichum salicis]